MLMNLKIFTVAGIAVATLTTGVFAQDKPVTPAKRSEDMATRDDQAKDKTQCCRASKILGREVENAQGDDLGEIEDLVLDESQGTIAYAVLEFGGFLGMGDRLFAIPFTALRKGEDDKFILDVSKETLKNAPGFDKDNWPDAADRTWGADIHRFYNQKPYWEHDTELSSNLDGNANRSGIDVNSRGAFAEPVDLTRVQNFEGTIVKVSKQSDAAQPMELTLKCGDRNVAVHLAPNSYLQGKSLQLAENDKIRVKGVVLEKMGKDQVVATEITKGNQVIPLRRSDGSPAWDRELSDPNAPKRDTNKGGSR